MATSTPIGAADLEAAHAELRRAALTLELEVEPVVELGPAARALERALGSLHDAADRRRDPVAALRAAGEAIDLGEMKLGSARSLDEKAQRVIDTLGRVRTLIARAESLLARSPAPPPDAPEDVVASGPLPRLHRVARPSLAPTLKVKRTPAPPPPPAAKLELPEPETFAELRAVIAEMKGQLAPRPVLPASPPSAPVPRTEPLPSPPGFAADVPAPLTDEAFLVSRARECFEEVAMVGLQRAPLLGDSWRSVAALDGRMLAAIDVVAALGPAAIAAVPRFFADAPVQDPPHAFALAMILGCFAGRDALAVVEHALLAGDRDEGSLRAFADALALVPHDALATSLRMLARDPDDRIRAFAIDVLGARGLATSDELRAAAGDVPKVAVRALVHLAHATPEGTAGPLDAYAGASDRGVREAIRGAMAASQHPNAAATLWRVIDADPEAPRWLAIVGDEEDARKLTRQAREAPTPALLDALGWAGDAFAIPLLIDLLGDDEGLSVPAAAALERLTGAGLVEPTEVEEDEILVREAPEPDVGEPRAPRLVAIVGDGRDPPPAPARERVDRPSTDPDRWRTFWNERGQSYEMRARYRRGHPYTPLVSLAELDRGAATLAERRLLQSELVHRTGAFVRLDPAGFVANQEEAIRAWHPLAARASSQPGRWGRLPRAR